MRRKNTRMTKAERTAFGKKYKRTKSELSVIECNDLTKVSQILEALKRESALFQGLLFSESSKQFRAKPEKAKK